MWKSVVLTGNNIHHPHIFPFDVARFVSLRVWNGAVHLVMMCLIVERHRDVCGMVKDDAEYAKVSRCVV